MNFTIFGYPKTGKTTLFNLLTGADIEVTAYESGKKDPHLRTCPVPDPRLDSLSSLYPDKDRKAAHIDYIDLAGLAFGEIKSESYLNHLRKADGLAHVVRGFEDPSVPHHRSDISPELDMKSMEEEIILADLMSVESRLDKLDQELKRGKTPEWERENSLLQGLKGKLEQNIPVRGITLAEAEEKLLRGFALLSGKPLFHMVNLDEKDIPAMDSMAEGLANADTKRAVLAFCGKIEKEILDLNPEEKGLFMAEYGLKELSDARFLRASYGLLDVITFFTIGKEEIKAWTISRGTTAHEAAGEIHSDIQKGFIRAEVIPWGELLDHGSFQAARENAAVRLEGKSYPVQDGDVVFFRFSS
jgi:GTP-binding protein YchF